MFRIKMADSKLWKNLVNAISTLIDEGTLNADKNGIKLRAMDPSHVAMVDFEWLKSAFNEYVCDEPTTLCINFNEMLKLLRRVSSNEPIDLDYDESNARLKIILKSRYTRTFSMATLEPSSQEVPTPKISFDSKARITTNCLKDCITDASTVSDQIVFETTEETLKLKSEGGLGEVYINIEKGSEELLSLEIKKPSKTTLSLNYLLEMVRAASKVSDIATIEFSTDKPIRLNFELPQHGRLNYYLAPRIESSY